MFVVQARTWAGAVLADLVCTRDARDHRIATSDSERVDEAADKLFHMALRIKCASSAERSHVCAALKDPIAKQISTIVDNGPSPSQKHHPDPAPLSPEPLEDDSIGVDGDRRLPFTAEAAAARAAVTSIVNSSEQSAKQLVCICI